jgi:hypothetical protein
MACHRWPERAGATTGGQAGMRRQIGVCLIPLVVLVGCTHDRSGTRSGAGSRAPASDPVSTPQVLSSTGPPVAATGAVALRTPVVLQLQGSGLHRATTGLEVASRNFDATVLVFRQPRPPACIEKAELSLYVVKVPSPPGPLAVYPSTVFDTGGDVTRYNGATILANHPRVLETASRSGWIIWDVTRVISFLSRDGHNTRGAKAATYPLEIRPPRFSPMGQVLPHDAWYFGSAEGAPTAEPILVVHGC